VVDDYIDSYELFTPFEIEIVAGIAIQSSPLAAPYLNQSIKSIYLSIYLLLLLTTLSKEIISFG